MPEKLKKSKNSKMALSTKISSMIDSNINNLNEFL